MSTLTSSDFGELKRPTTRVHAPPGGGSNWSLGDSDNTPAQSRGRRQHDVHMSSPPQVAQPAVVVPPPAPLPSPTRLVETKTEATTHRDGKLRVALVKTQCDAEIVDLATQNCWDKLQQNTQLTSETFTVPSLDEIPYAANKLAQFGDFDGIICFGFMNTVDPTTSALSTALTQSLIDISVKNVKPVIRAIFTGEPRVASVKAKGGWGSEYAANIEGLIRLGGFVGPIVHHAEGTPVHRSFQISRGNILPPQLLGASQDVLSTLDTLRTSLYKNGAIGIAGLGRSFRIMDDDNNRQLNRSEFTKAMNEHGLKLSEREIENLFLFVDADNSGGINFDEFLVALRGELNQRREQMVLAAFRVLDADGNGVIELKDIVQKYSADKHPDVIAGGKTKAQVLREFLDTFDGGDKDGKVRPIDFLRYYANVSASIDDDDYFELMIRNAWHISGGEGWCENTTCRRVLVTHADGHQTVEEVKNDIGVTASNVEAIRANLQAQGISHPVSIETKGVSMEDRNDGKRGADTFQPKFVKKKQLGAGDSSIVFG